MKLDLEKMTRLAVPASTIATLSDVSHSDLCRFINGVKRPSDHAVQKINETISQLERLIEGSRPLPLDFRRVAALKEILSEMDSGHFRVLIERSDKAATPELRGTNEH